MRTHRRLSLAHLLIAATAAWTLNGCAPDEAAQFEIDYTEDYEADREEDTAEAEEFAERDVLDDLADPDDEGEAPVTPAAGLLRQALGPQPGPLSIMQDDPHFTGEFADWTGVTDGDRCKARFEYRDADAQKHLRQAHALGARIVRVMLYWTSVIPCLDNRREDRPAFDATNPERYYVWDRIDTLVRNAHTLKDEQGRPIPLKVLITITGSIPYWASSEPWYCTLRAKEGASACSWKPDPKEYGKFVYAVGKHFRDTARFGGRRIWGWTLWNEPNFGGENPFLSAGDAFTVSGTPQGGTQIVPRKCLAEAGHCRDLFDTAMLYRRLWFTGLRHIRLSDCKQMIKVDGRRTCKRSRIGWVYFGDTANEVARDEVARFASYALCLKAQNVAEPEPDLVEKKLLRHCPQALPGEPGAARRVYTRGLAVHLYAPSASSAAESVKDMQLFLRGAEKAGTATVWDRLPPRREVYVTEDGYRTDARHVSLADQGPKIDLAERLLHEAGVRTVAQYTLYDDVNYVCGLRFALSAWKPNYQCWMAGQLDPQQCGAHANDEMCSDACKQLVLARQGQPKPAFAHYQMPMWATRQGNEVTLFVLARTGVPDSTLLVDEVRRDGTPVRIGVLMVNGRGYGEASFSLQAGIAAYRVTDPWTGLSRQVPVP